MRDFSFSCYGFLPFDERDNGKVELNLKEHLEQRFKESQYSQNLAQKNAINNIQLDELCTVLNGE